MADGRVNNMNQELYELLKSDKRADTYVIPQRVMDVIVEYTSGCKAKAYKQGYIDGSIEVVNNTCDICGSYPMTTNCNNAGCDV